MARLIIVTVLLACAVAPSPATLADQAASVLVNVDQSEPIPDRQDESWSEEYDVGRKPDCPEGKIFMEESSDGVVTPICEETTSAPSKPTTSPASKPKIPKKKKAAKIAPAVKNVTISNWPTMGKYSNGSMRTIKLTIAKTGISKCCGFECVLRAIVVNTCTHRCWATQKLVFHWTSQLRSLVKTALRHKTGVCHGHLDFCKSLVSLLRRECKVKGKRSRRSAEVDGKSVDNHAEAESIKALNLFNKNMQLLVNQESRERRSTQHKQHHHWVMHGGDFFTLWNRTQSACCHSAHGCSESFFTDNMCVLKESQFH